MHDSIGNNNPEANSNNRCGMLMYLMAKNELYRQLDGLKNGMMWFPCRVSVSGNDMGPRTLQWKFVARKKIFFMKIILSSCK